MVKIEFTTDNAAFSEGPATEIARILERLAKKIRMGDFDEPIMDINGNRVGTMTITAD